MPSFVVEHIRDLPERPDIDAKGFNTGIVRFQANGSPNWAVEFTSVDLTLSGSLSQGSNRTTVDGSGTLRGAMVTRYWNFFSTRYISGGLGSGFGVANLEASYTRSLIASGLPPISVPGDSFEHWLPTFQTVAQLDVRPVRWISLSPFYGLRNGNLGMGGAVRIHLTR